MLFKNVASQKIHIYAYDSTTGAAKTGDAANITAYVSLDGTANAIDDTNPAEVDATNMPGVYVFDLAQAETNCNSFALYAKSATSNIRIEPIIGFTTGAAVTQTGDSYARLGAPAGASHAADVAAVKVDTAAVKAKTDSLTFTVAGFVDANFKRLNDATFTGDATVPATIPTGGITSDSFAAGAITAAAIATGAIDADALAADAGTEIGAAVKTAIEAAGSHLTLIKTKTDYLPSATAGAAGGVFIAGTNAPVTITGSGNALSLISTGADGSGLVATGNSNGHGIHATGGIGLTSWDIYSGGNGIKDVQDMITNYIDPILSDTDEMQKDLVNNGRIDLLIDSIVSYVDCLPATWVTVPTAAQVSTQVASDLAAAHGAGSWATATGFSTHSAADVKTALEADGSKLDVLYDDWLNGGRLDLLLDAAAAGGDVFSTELPGAYAVGTAGYIIGTNLDAKVSEAGGGAGDGTGADEVTITWTSNGLPVGGGDVWITTDPSGDNVVAGTLQTNDNGQATFMLDDGSVYFLWGQRSGVNSIRGERFVAVAD